METRPPKRPASTNIPPGGKDFTSLPRAGAAGTEIKAKSLKQKLCFGARRDMSRKLQKK